MKKIMLIGSEGSIGRRYKAVLKYLGVDVKCYDIKPGVDVESCVNDDCDGFIVAAPTSSHVSWCRNLLIYEKPILCEKPLGVNVLEVEELSKYAGANEFISVVDNWVHMLQVKGKTNLDLKYRNFHTGNEKLSWNLAQPIYLTKDGNLELFLDFPHLIISNVTKEKSYDAADVEHSYIQMIQYWLTYKTTTWKVSHALEMQLALEAWEKKQ